MKPLEKFGQFMIANLRDVALGHSQLLLVGYWKCKAVQEVQRRLSELPQEQRDLFLEAMMRVIDTALHDLPFPIPDSHDRSLGVEVLVDGVNVADESGMLHGEPFGEKGWINLTEYALSNPVNFVDPLGLSS